MPQLVIIRGLPGAGKSTFANTYYPSHELREADQFFMKDGQYNYDATLVHKAHDWCLYEVLNLLNNDINVVVANTFVTNKHISRYVKLALLIPYTTIGIVELQPRFTSIHNVPEETMKLMALKWQPLNEANKQYLI